MRMSNTTCPCDDEQLPHGIEEDGENVQTRRNERDNDIIYGVEDTPQWYWCILLGIQHCLTLFGATVSVPFILAPALCIAEDDPARGYLTSTVFFVSGVVTLIQTTFGIRLPIVQSTTFTFLVPTFAILSLDRWKMIPDVNVTDSYNITSDELYGKWNCPTEALLNLTNWTSEEIWQPRIREIQGAIILASFGEVIIGFSGLAGCILSKVTPLTVTPTVALVGLSLFKEAADLAGQNWPISVTTIALLLLFSEYLKNVKISLPKRLTRDKKLSSFPVFKIFPVILSISLIWLLCFILTVTNQFPADSSARTDRSNLISKSPWFRFPYPGQWGTPTFSIGAVFGMFSGVLAGIIESIGDYYACARLSGAPPPPVHAINRGISIEGLGCVLAGIWGSGNGTTSFSENIGVIGVTKVASRRVVQVAAVYLIWFACLSKVGAFFTTIPVPIVGGMFCVTFSMICAVGLSNLQYVNLNSTRNLLILGMSLFLGLAIPNWMKINKNVIQTGLVELDQIITVLLETSVFVGGFLGFVLDNTMPGNEEDRGITTWRSNVTGFDNSCGGHSVDDVYGLPLINEYVMKFKAFRYIPFCPGYRDINIKHCLRRKKVRRTYEARSDQPNISTLL